MKGKFYFILLTALTVIITIATKILLETENLIINSLSTHLSQNQIEDFIDFNTKWSWVNYFLTPIFIYIKINLVTAVINFGLFLFNKEMTYKRLFKYVTIAEFIFLLMIIVKLLWLLFQENIILEDIQYFYPLSALNFIGYEGLAPWFVYPFQVLNLFELAYWLVLAYLLGKELKTSTDEGLKIVASSYGPALLIWVVTVMFFTLNMS